MKNDIVKIASKIIRDGRLDPDRRSASWHHLTVQIISDHVGDYLTLWYPVSRIPGRMAGVEAHWTMVRRFDPRWDGSPSRCGVAVCGNLRNENNRALNDRMMGDLIKRIG